MVDKLWSILTDFLKSQPFWSRIQPVVVLASFYIAALCGTYELLKSWYGLSPSLGLYLRSYVVKQITIGFVAVVFSLFVLTRKRKRAQRERRPRPLLVFLRRYATRLCIVAGILTVAFVLASNTRPRSVKRITIHFVDQPEFDQDAFVYLIYELNRIQNKWYYYINFDVFNDVSLTSSQRKAVKDDAIAIARTMTTGREPTIAITNRKLPDGAFWNNDGNLSVITTYGWKGFEPPTVYEFLIHSVLVQSIVLHLSSSGIGLPAGSFRQTSSSYNDLFSSIPRRSSMRAAIAASRLRPESEEMLFNVFGAEYLSVCNRLLTKEWMRTPQVKQNLRVMFNVTLDDNNAPKSDKISEGSEK